MQQTSHSHLVDELEIVKQTCLPRSSKGKKIASILKKLDVGPTALHPVLLDFSFHDVHIIVLLHYILLTLLYFLLYYFIQIPILTPQIPQQEDLYTETIDIDIAQFLALFDYGIIIDKLQYNNVDEVSQHGRHLGNLLKWSIVDSKL